MTSSDFLISFRKIQLSKTLNLSWVFLKNSESKKKEKGCLLSNQIEEEVADGEDKILKEKDD